MRRPDQDRFDAFARHFGAIDSELASFAETNGFRLEVNLLRQPNRVLRRTGNPEFLIDISLSEHWLKARFEEDMPHTMTAIGYYTSADSRYVWRVEHETVVQQKFSVLRQNLAAHLAESVRIIELWTPEAIVRKGQRSENLRIKYRATPPQ